MPRIQTKCGVFKTVVRTRVEKVKLATNKKGFRETFCITTRLLVKHVVFETRLGLKHFVSETIRLAKRVVLETRF